MVKATCLSLLTACISACLLFSGCGENTSSSDGRNAAANSQTVFSSPVLRSDKTIPETFRCTSSIWLPLSWKSVPDGTAELAVNVQAFGKPQRENGRIVWTPVVAGSLITGLKSDLHALPVGKVPNGALVRRENNVPACPRPSPHEKYVFRLFAIPRGHTLAQTSTNSESPFEVLNRLVREGRTIGEFFPRRSYPIQ
jgi:phosphatidylethanolamine-binding protein (PEBP) family uncharacterized protein